MSVWVRLRPMELTNNVATLEFDDADDFYVHPDHRLEVLRAQEVIANVHPDRWEVVSMSPEGAR